MTQRTWSWSHYVRVGKDGRIDRRTLDAPLTWSEIQRRSDEGWALIVDEA